MVSKDGEHRCEVGGAHDSSPASSEQQDKHNEVDHALFTESFDTISACPSTLDTMQEPNSEDEGLMSLHSKTETEEDAMGLLPSPPKRESRHNSQSSSARNSDYYNSSMQTGELKENWEKHRKCSPHSPPQRVVHVDGDDNGYGDISPIKFSPPDESSTTPHRGLARNYEHAPYISTPVSGRNERQKAAEVSFDTSAGSRESNDHRNTTSMLSDATTPPRRGTSRSQYSNEVKYEPKHSMPPHFPRELADQYYAGSHYPHHPPVLPEVHRQHRGTPFHGDRSQVYQHTRKNNMERVGFSSPIRASRPSYTKSNPKQGPNNVYTEPAHPVAPVSYNSGEWRGHNSYSSDIRDYPPPRARLPPPNDHPYWRQKQDAVQHQHPSRHPYHHFQGTRQIDSNGKNEKCATIAETNQSRYPPVVSRQCYPYAQRSSTALVSGVVPKDPFDLFRSIRTIFQGCSYLLYPAHMGIPWGDNHAAMHTDPEDLKVARRRVESAICALGGYIKDVQQREDSPKHSSSPSSQSQTTPPPNVFRSRMAFSRRNSNSSIYKDKFHHRYFVGDHGISWDVEENPPVIVSTDEDDHIRSQNVSSTRNNGTGRIGIQMREKQVEKGHKQVQQSKMNGSDSIDICQPLGSTTLLTLNHKMKYRCKLCGQPKSDHVCPYRKSMVRTLGVMVCPAVNAYSSAEPGILSPPLSEMNNFVPYGRTGPENSDVETDVSSRGQNSASTYNVTPGSNRKQNDGSRRYHSPSSLSTSPHSHQNQSYGHGKSYQAPTKRVNLWQQRKPILEQRAQQPFFMTLALRPEHYRAVTPLKPYRNASRNSKVADQRDDKEETGSYQYPHVPLTFAGRKWLTDTLFYLSQSIPSMTADVASLLRMARERDEWDLAVAEVLTQVVVCVHCPNGDYRLDGLKNYLLRIGIAS